ncbi:MAG: methyltransferase domain-containing protein [Anaerolineae bacterium]|nr:methyltransferase domain-containing protein [Anaerolineae bacterium]
MLFKKIADNSEDNSYATTMRRKRFGFFMSLLAGVPRPLSILDVGGTQGFWERMDFTDEPGISITLINLKPQPVRYAGFTSIIGDATDLSVFSDDAFDVVFSNSVIEHVGGINEQSRMAQEVIRVGRRYFVQTPNYYFPIEPHYLFPGFQWLPLEVRAWLLNHFNLGWSKRKPTIAEARESVDSVRLLRKDELLTFFPHTNLYEEKLAGLTKSFVVYDGWD